MDVPTMLATTMRRRGTPATSEEPPSSTPTDVLTEPSPLLHSHSETRSHLLGKVNTRVSAHRKSDTPTDAPRPALDSSPVCREVWSATVRPCPYPTSERRPCPTPPRPPGPPLWVASSAPRRSAVHCCSSPQR